MSTPRGLWSSVEPSAGKLAGLSIAERSGASEPVQEGAATLAGSDHNQQPRSSVNQQQQQPCAEPGYGPPDGSCGSIGGYGPPGGDILFGCGWGVGDQDDDYGDGALALLL